MGDIFLYTEEMRFANNYGTLRVCCSPNGMPISFWGENFNKAKVKTPKEYLEYRVNLGALRNGGKIIINEYKDFISIPKIGILDTLKIPLQIGELKVDENTYFYVRYKYKNKEINKKLICLNDTLLISNYIFELENIGQIQPDSYPISIYLYNDKKEESALLSHNFYPVFMDLSILKKDLSNIMNQQYLSSEDKLQIIEDYLAIEYSDIYFFKNNLNVLIQSK
jgi:hypothetical protein